MHVDSIGLGIYREENDEKKDKKKENRHWEDGGEIV